MKRGPRSLEHSPHSLMITLQSNRARPGYLRTDSPFGHQAHLPQAAPSHDDLLAKPNGSNGLSSSYESACTTNLGLGVIGRGQSVMEGFGPIRALRSAVDRRRRPHAWVRCPLPPNPGLGPRSQVRRVQIAHRGCVACDFLHERCFSILPPTATQSFSSATNLARGLGEIYAIGEQISKSPPRLGGIPSPSGGRANRRFTYRRIYTRLNERGGMGVRVMRGSQSPDRRNHGKRVHRRFPIVILQV